MQDLRLADWGPSCAATVFGPPAVSTVQSCKIICSSKSQQSMHCHHGFVICFCAVPAWQVPLLSGAMSNWLCCRVRWPNL